MNTPSLPPLLPIIKAVKEEWVRGAVSLPFLSFFTLNSQCPLAPVFLAFYFPWPHPALGRIVKSTTLSALPLLLLFLYSLCRPLPASPPTPSQGSTRRTTNRQYIIRYLLHRISLQDWWLARHAGRAIPRLLATGWSCYLQRSFFLFRETLVLLLKPFNWLNQAHSDDLE